MAVDELEPRNDAAVDRCLGDFHRALQAKGFAGEFADDVATQITYSTDNSIYQIEPKAVLFPMNGDDLRHIMTVANQPPFRKLTFFPRGGGTGCNGQSLGNGVVIDTSRFMRRIIEFDAKEQLVEVEPGVIRDQLEEFLKPHGLFFPPHVSTSSRATIGGMVSNDSSGKGSLIYGKTSAHIEAFDLVLADGRELHVSRTNDGELGADIGVLIAPHQAEIRKAFPDLIRSFTGYDVLNGMDEQGVVDVPALICGSEGSLALISSVTCRVTPIPLFTGVVPVRYASLDVAFRSIPALIETKPTAIEFIDDKILAMARESEFWAKAGSVLGGTASEAPAKAMHFVEFQAESIAALERKISDLETHLKSNGNCNGWSVATEPEQVKTIWDLRKACQGLLLARQDKKRAQPFIEDFVVPPRHLAEMIADLTNVLESHGVDVGMFGHADVGVVHMRPLLDMTQPADRALIRTISDEVQELTSKYNGMVWGEHGKGFRGEYMSQLLGPRLSELMVDIKTMFDPNNRLNPGKITPPRGSSKTIPALDQVPMRGALDQSIKEDLRMEYPKALHCNGNGNCFALDAANPICPSYKATGDRRLSPKGRAGLIREWLRLRSLNDQNALGVLAPQIKESLDLCLSCKSCSGSACPVRIDIPEMKSGFLNWYHLRHRRPLSDYFVRHLENLLPFLARIAPLINAIATNRIIRGILEKIGLVDLPLVQGRTFTKRLKQLDIAHMSAREITALPRADRSKLVVIVQDSFTRFFDEEAALAQATLMMRLGARVCVLDYEASGKALHVKGFQQAFEKQASRHARTLTKLTESGVRLVGMDPATVLLYRHEYASLPVRPSSFNVEMFSEWLSQTALPTLTSDAPLVLFQHCTEKSLEPATTRQWREVFCAFGLSVEIPKTGCCGMAGLFGHETANQAISKTLFDQTWCTQIKKDRNAIVMVTGYSCRSQVKRFSHTEALHPARVIINLLDAQESVSKQERKNVR